MAVIAARGHPPGLFAPLGRLTDKHRARIRLWLNPEVPAMPPVRPFIPQQETFGLGQIEAPTCHRRIPQTLDVEAGTR